MPETVHLSPLSIIIKTWDAKLIAYISQDLTYLRHVFTRYRRKGFLFPLPINKIEETPFNQFGGVHNLPSGILGLPSLLLTSNTLIQREPLLPTIRLLERPLDTK
ncbi:hypothetical protein BJJ97_20080 [Pectobacterium polaris]|nr:hypothetical protein BJJ97_20080 [Pectobacterium polaris]